MSLPLSLEQVAAMNPHDLHMYAMNTTEQPRTTSEHIKLPVYIDSIVTPFKIEVELYRGLGDPHSKYRLFQLCEDLNAFAQFMHYIEPNEKVGRPVVEDNCIRYTKS